MTEEFTRVRLLWPDLLGLARGKYLPARMKADKTGHCMALFALGFDRDMTPHDGACFFEGLPDLEARFDPESVRAGWEKGTGIAIPDVYKDGEPIFMAPRQVLKKAIAEWDALGYTPKVGIELEAFLFEPDERGRFAPIDTPGAYVYGTGTSVDPRGVVDDLMETCERVGLKLESVHSEYDNGQFELTLEYDDALAACDDAFLFKVLAKEVAHRQGCLFTFMAKPVNGRGGSGTHVNLSLEKEGKNQLHDPKAEDGLSQVAHRMLGGLMEHHIGMTAVCSPTVNSYKRLRPGQMCGYWANWGYDHRGVAVRIPPARAQATRLEHRLADASVNPHIATAAVLQGARLGVVSEKSPPPAETADCWESADTDRHVATSLGVALDDLEADRVFADALSSEYVAAFLAIKRAEWNRYQTHTSDWEMNEYLHFL